MLIVEDDPLILLSAGETLREAGFHVLEAETVDAALALLHANDGAVDVIFTDVETPGRLDGLALVQIARESWPRVPVLVTSGRVRLGPDVLPICAGFVPKPYDPGMVADLITDLAKA